MPFSPLKQSRYDPDGDGSVESADSSASADDADTVDGQHAADIGKGTDEVRNDTMIHNAGFAPGFGG